MSGATALRSLTPWTASDCVTRMRPGSNTTSLPVAVICRTGNRSELATMMLQARGFEAYNVEGGMEAWAAEGLPYAADDGSPGRVA